jgi:hypothetical protein
MTNFRLSSAQFAHTLLFLGAAMAQQASNAQGRGDYVRLANVFAGCAPTGGSYEVQLTPAQIEQIGAAVQTARGIGNTPPEYGRWLNDVEQIWGAGTSAGAAGGR